MFWDNFYNICTKNGKTPNLVAKELGISSGSITAYKNGRLPRPNILKAFADYFGVSVDYFLNDEPEEIKKDPTPKTGNEVSDLDTFTLNILHKLTPEYQEKAIAHLLELAAKSANNE